MAPLKRTSLVDQLYDQIKNNIITLTYPLGSKLNVNELQEIFGVSSTPLREAITRLQAEGLVINENNVGARITTLSPKDIQDIQDLALTLHTAAVRLAMERGDRQKVAEEVVQFARGYQNAKTSQAKIKNIFDLIGAFYRHSGNTRLDNNMKIIQGQQLILRHLYYGYLGVEKANTDQYERIAQATEAGDVGKIIEVFYENYERSTPILIEALDDFTRKHPPDKSLK